MHFIRIMHFVLTLNLQIKADKTNIYREAGISICKLRLNGTEMDGIKNVLNRLDNIRLIDV